MSEEITIEQIAAWLGAVQSFPLVVSPPAGEQVSLTVGGAVPVTVTAAAGSLTATGGREFPSHLQNVLDGRQLQSALATAARSCALPSAVDLMAAGGGQGASIKIQLFLDGLTRNELAAAVWSIWKMQELVETHLAGAKDLLALSARAEGRSSAVVEAVSDGAAGATQSPPQAEPLPAEPAIEPELMPEPVAASPDLPLVAETEPASPPEEAVPETPAPSESRLFCWNCGKEARPGARFCNGCGAGLEE